MIAEVRDMCFLIGTVSSLSSVWTGAANVGGCAGGFDCWRAACTWLRRLGSELERCSALGVPTIGGPPGDGPVGFPAEKTVPESTLGIADIAGTTSRTDRPRKLKGRFGEVSSAVSRLRTKATRGVLGRADESMNGDAGFSDNSSSFASEWLDLGLRCFLFDFLLGLASGDFVPRSSFSLSKSRKLTVVALLADLCISFSPSVSASSPLAIAPNPGDARTL